MQRNAQRRTRNSSSRIRTASSTLPGRFTKAQVIEYYVNVSRWLLPHFKQRP
jgi:DNA primase